MALKIMTSFLKIAEVLGIADETNEEGINYATTSVTTPVIGATSGNEFEIFPQFPESDAAAGKFNFF